MPLSKLCPNLPENGKVLCLGVVLFLAFVTKSNIYILGYMSWTTCKYSMIIRQSDCTKVSPNHSFAFLVPEVVPSLSLFSCFGRWYRSLRRLQVKSQSTYWLARGLLLPHKSRPHNRRHLGNRLGALLVSER